MYTQFDEKGKIFTNVVTKKPIRVIIQTTMQEIHGEVHVKVDERLKDALRGEDPFLAVTNATIYSLDHEPLYRTGFITVNHSHIIWVTPVDELVEAGNEQQ